MQGELHEECGVFGVYHLPGAANLTYLGLHALQHRGQESAGIAVSDGDSIRCRKGHGLVTEALSSQKLAELTGENAVGHVRYSTAGGGEWENIQPLLVRAKMGSLAAVHNGQIANARELREELEEQGSIFSSSSDSEILLHLIQRGRGSLLEKLQDACRRLEGAFAFLVLTEQSLYAIRDCNGLRPLSVARRGQGYCVSSESCAFHLIEAEEVRELEPGEILKFTAGGMESHRYTADTRHRLCAMEYVYFARPDSDIEGRNVHSLRRRTGRLLARGDKDLKADMVVGVPDSSLSAAMGYSEGSGLPFEMGLIKNRYVGRTFIQPTQELRDSGVKMKLAANRSAVEGKRLVLLDDSIVRGTTSRRIVRLLKEAGAREVHLRIASPPLRYPCFYGVDISTQEELISARLSVPELCRFVGADSLRFLTEQEMQEAYGGEDFCFACFDGRYVTRV